MRLVLFTASVFAVAAVTALVLTLAQSIPGIPLFSTLFGPPLATPQIIVTDTQKLVILRHLDDSSTSTSQSDKEAVLRSLTQPTASPATQKTTSSAGAGTSTPTPRAVPASTRTSSGSSVSEQEKLKILESLGGSPGN